MIGIYIKLQGKIEYYWKNCLLRFWFIYTYWNIHPALKPLKGFFLFFSPLFTVIFCLMWLLKRLGRIISFIPILNYLYFWIYILFDCLEKGVSIFVNLPILSYYTVYTKYRNKDYALKISSIHEVEDRIRKETHIGEIKGEYKYDKAIVDADYKKAVDVIYPGVDEKVNKAFTQMFNQCKFIGDLNAKTVKKSYYLSFELGCLAIYYFKWRAANMRFDGEKSAALIDNFTTLLPLKLGVFYKNWDRREDLLLNRIDNRLMVYDSVIMEGDFTNFTSMMEKVLEQTELFVTKNVIYKDISPREYEDMSFHLDYEDTLRVRKAIKHFYEDVLRARGASDLIANLFA